MPIFRKKVHWKKAKYYAEGNINVTGRYNGKYI